MSGPILLSCTTATKAVPYLEALRLSGVPGHRVEVVAADQGGWGDAAPRAAQAAGLLLTGGPDVAPERYGEEPHPNANLEIVPERDELEWQLLAGARQGRTPVFGVCRGLQVLNAFLGGTLWQDLKLQWPGSLLHDLSFPRDALIHPLHVTAPDSRLGEVLSREVSLVNSRHHQAIKQLAPGLGVVATAPDGIVEAAVSTQPDWWVWGFQWHPENLVSLAVQRSLWERFAAVTAARATAEPEVLSR